MGLSPVVASAEWRSVSHTPAFLIPDTCCLIADTRHLTPDTSLLDPVLVISDIRAQTCFVFRYLPPLHSRHPA